MDKNYGQNSRKRSSARLVPEKLPPYQEACLHVYDAVDYAENSANVPVVAYAGEKDSQLQAARNIEAHLKPLGIPMTLLVAPGLAQRLGTRADGGAAPGGGGHERRDPVPLLGRPPMIGIVVDSNAQMPPSLVERFGVTVVPLPVTVNGVQHLEGVDLDADAFYALFEDGTPEVSTAQPAPGEEAERTGVPCDDRVPMRIRPRYRTAVFSLFLRARSHLS